MKTLSQYRLDKLNMRDRLLKIMYDRMLSIRAVTIEMGFVNQTQVSVFLENDNYFPRMKGFMKIEKFLIENEAKMMDGLSEEK